MNKLLLSLLALVTLATAITSTVHAYDVAKKPSKTASKTEGSHVCSTCHKPVCREKKEKGHKDHHCNCAHEVCVKEVKAVEHAPMIKEQVSEDVCPEKTEARTDKHGNLECIEYRAEEVKHKPICNKMDKWTCPPGYTEEPMTPGHRIDRVHDNRHTAYEKGGARKRNASTTAGSAKREGKKANKRMQSTEANQATDIAAANDDMD